MRFVIKLVLPLAVIVTLAIGLVPPFFDKGNLDSDALNAAKAGASAVFASGSGIGSQLSRAEAAVQLSLAGKSGITLVSVRVNPPGTSNTVEVTLTETVHTFMEGFPGLKSWFHLRSTQQSELGL